MIKTNQQNIPTKPTKTKTQTSIQKCCDTKLPSATSGSLEIAIVPDLHCHGGSDKTIPELIARWLDEYRPDVVVNLGDHWDLPSLAFQTKGQHSSAIGPTFQSDVAAGIQANDVIWKTYQRAKDRWNCHRIILEGNHENRMARATEEPERWSLRGLLDYSILQTDRYYDEVVRYKGSTPGLTSVGGVTFRHYAPNGMSRPLNSMHLGYQLTQKMLTSTVVGHTHRFSYFRTTASDARVVHGLVAGCCISEDDFHEYAGTSQTSWDRGVACLHGCENGNYSLEWVNLNRLQQLYG